MTRFEKCKNALKEETKRICGNLAVSLNYKADNIMRNISDEDIAFLACVEDFEMANSAIMRFIRNTRTSGFADADIEVMRIAYINTAEKIAVSYANEKIVVSYANEEKEEA